MQNVNEHLNVNTHLLSDLEEACRRAEKMASVLDEQSVDYLTVQVGKVLVTVQRIHTRTGVPNIRVYRHPATDADANVVSEVECIAAE